MKSQAQQKREKQLREQLSNQIGNLLIEFQDRYLGSYVQWNINKLSIESIEWKNKIHLEPQRLEDVKQKIKDGFPRWKLLTWDNTKNYEYQIERIEKILSRPHILTLNSITEAKKGYDIKFNKLIDKLTSYDFSTSYVTVEKVNDVGNELSFLISNKEYECHARIIFANGEINAPHYRFITTLRKK